MIKIEVTRHFDSIVGDFTLKKSEPEVICDKCDKQVVDRGPLEDPSRGFCERRQIIKRILQRKV